MPRTSRIKIWFAPEIFAGARTNRDPFWSIRMPVPASQRVMDRPLHGLCMNDLQRHNDTTMGVYAFHQLYEPYFTVDR
jgi:hypothetical protein